MDFRRLHLDDRLRRDPARASQVDGWVDARRQQLVEAKIFQLMLALPADRRPEVVRDLAGFCKARCDTPEKWKSSDSPCLPLLIDAVDL